MFTFLVFLSAFLLESIGTYVSVVGLAHLFAYSKVVMVMAVALDIAKVVSVTFLYRHWKQIGWTMKSYMLSATLVLMLITSTGVFGFLSGEFQRAISGTNQQAVIIQSLTEEQGRLQKRKEEIDKQIAQLPDNAVRGRRQLMQQFGPEVNRLNERLAEIDKKLPELKVENIGAATHVGPILYVAEAFKTTPEQAVKWVILIIIFVFDPLAIALLVAGNSLLRKKPEEDEEFVHHGKRALVMPPEVTPEAEALYRGIHEHPAFTKEGAHAAFGNLVPNETTQAAMEESRELAARHIHGNPNFTIEKVAEDVKQALTGIGIPKPLTGEAAAKAVREAGVVDEAGNLTENFAPEKKKRKYVRKPKAAPAPEPVREKVVIKNTVKKPAPPKVVVATEGEKEVIKIEKPLMKSSLEDLKMQADTTDNQKESKVKGTYEQE